MSKKNFNTFNLTSRLVVYISIISLMASCVSVFYGTKFSDNSTPLFNELKRIGIIDDNVTPDDLIEIISQENFSDVVFSNQSNISRYCNQLHPRITGLSLETTDPIDGKLYSLDYNPNNELKLASIDYYDIDDYTKIEIDPYNLNQLDGWRRSLMFPGSVFYSSKTISIIPLDKVSWLENLKDNASYYDPQFLQVITHCNGNFVMHDHFEIIHNIIFNNHITGIENFNGKRSEEYVQEDSTLLRFTYNGEQIGYISMLPLSDGSNEYELQFSRLYNPYTGEYLNNLELDSSQIEQLMDLTNQYNIENTIPREQNSESFHNRGIQ